MDTSDKRGISRRQFLKKTIVGTGGFLTWAVLGGCDRGSYSRGNRGPATKSIALNTGWCFGEAVEGSSNVNFDDSELKSVILPHTVADLSWQKWDPASWEKKWIYRRHFELDEDLKGKRVFLEIGAAMTAATVTLNGKKLGEHAGGYLPLNYELTKALNPGENILVVELDSRFDVNVPPNKPGKDPRSVDFWQPGGVYRPAQLHIVPDIFLEDVFAKPVNVLDSNRKLDIACTIDAVSVPRGTVQVSAELVDGDKKIGTVSKSVDMKGRSQSTVNLTLDNLDDIRLWDINDPYLYDVFVTLSVDNKPVHDYAVRTGFREAKFTKEGFFLNGERVQLFGVNRHQFYPFAGGAMPGRVQAKDAEILRSDLNCNMVRCSHYPQSEAFFDACDELGLLAWEEAAGWGRPIGDEQWKQRAVHAVDQMIRRDRNHPSIVVWGSRLNETPDDVELYTKTRDLARKLDDSRQTTGAMVGGLHDTKDYVQDVFSYNDYASSKAPDGSKQPELLPPRTDLPYFVSEAVGTLSGPAKHYRRIDSAESQQGQAIAHARVHNIAASDKRYCGLVAWSGYDYPSGTGNQYDGTKYTGIIDLFRVPKPGAAIYQAQVNPKERAVIMPAFYWDFGPETLPMKSGAEAVICSNCDYLELFVNGEHYETAHPEKNRFAHLPYPPSFVSFDKVDGSNKPELRIEGYVGEQKVITRSFSSDPSEDKLSLIPDDKELIADGTDATRVVFRAVDKYGAPRRHVHGEVTLSLDGPATLVGETKFSFEASGGVGAAWVRTQPQRTGNIRLRADHPTLGSEAITIGVKKSAS